MKTIKEDIKKQLQEVLKNGPKLTAAILYLDQIKTDPYVANNGQLTHFLERRSYQKAWDHLANESDKS